MAVSFDVAADAHSGKTASGLTFDSGSTSASASLLLVFVTVGGTGSPAPSVSSITYGGVSLGSAVKIQTSGNARIELWKLISPASGVNSIVITLSSATDGNSIICAGAMSFIDSDLSTPLGTAVSASGSGTTPTVDITDSATDDLVIDGVVLGSDSAVTAGAGQTKRWEELVGADSYGNNGAGSTEAGASGTVTMSWTVGDDAWGIIGVTIKQASATITIDQEGFRFRNDDGNEASATWDGAQDTDITQPQNTTRRIRFILNTTGNANAILPKLEGKPANAANWIGLS